MTKKQMDRLAEKYHRLAYQLEADAARVKATSWHPSYADDIKAISSRLGSLARAMEREIS